MNRSFFFFLLLISVCFHSCITDIEEDRYIKPKLVLSCYLVPQLDTTILFLTSSAPLITSNPKPIESIANAIVEISNNSAHWVKMEYDSENQVYFIPQTVFPIEEGKTYHVRASASGFETISASCTVPWLRETNLSLVVKESINDIHWGKIYNELHYHSYLEWTDFPGEDNYYMFCNKEFYEEEWWDWHTNFPFEKDTFYFYRWNFLYDVDINTCIYSDKDNDGKKMSVLMIIGYPDIYELTLLQMDRNCYLFETSIMNSIADFQSFLLEPAAPLYTNIKNGYGVFGAFVMKDYSFELHNTPSH